ncbi:MAG: hypothetical protein IJ680_03775 [Paludibacteraceae bacterium]|nr:hypothetical protein [Paludibacteraceae bacterium]
MKTKIVYLLTAFALTAVCAACGSKAASDGTEEASKGAVMLIDDVLEQAGQLVGDTIRFEGVCTHICKRSGRKIFLMGSDDTKTLRVEDAGLGKFDPRCVNHVVCVTGVLREQRIDEEYLKFQESLLEEQAAGRLEGQAGGCETEQKARQETASTPEQRIADMRARIAEREQQEGKAYLSFYFVDAVAYEIAEK